MVLYKCLKKIGVEYGSKTIIISNILKILRKISFLNDHIQVTNNNKTVIINYIDPRWLLGFLKVYNIHPKMIMSPSVYAKLFWAVKYIEDNPNFKFFNF